jgi:AcrR family transcriptional regulator
VPKRVDHEERRRQIADALLRAAAARGLHATGMREVAAEAGVSLRLVQYYFGTKEELLLAGMQRLAARFGERAMTRIRRAKETGGQASPRDVIAAILAEALPADDERRTFAVLNTAYFALALTDPALAIAPLVKNTNAVIDVIAAQLRAAQAAGDAPTDLDPDAEAISVLAMSAGLGNSVLAGQSSAEQAQAVIDYQLNRLFPVSRLALCRASLAARPQPYVGSGRLHRLRDRDGRRPLTSVNAAIKWSTTLRDDTRWDKETTARIAENPQPAGHLPRWWQVLGTGPAVDAVGDGVPASAKDVFVYGMLRAAATHRGPQVLGAHLRYPLERLPDPG